MYLQSKRETPWHVHAVRLCAVIAVVCALALCTAPRMAYAEEVPIAEPSSDTPSEITPTPAPTVTLDAVTPHKDGIHLSWSISSEVLGFKVVRVDNTTHATKTIAHLGAHERSNIDTHLNANHSYTYRVDAEYTSDNVNQVAQSNESSVRIQLTKPSLQVSQKKKSTTANLSWSVIPCAQKYVIDYSSNRLFTSYKSVGVGGLVASKAIKKLAKGTTYFFRIKEYGSIGDADLESSWGYSASALNGAHTSRSYIKEKQKFKRKVTKKKVVIKKKKGNRVRIKVKKKVWKTYYKKVRLELRGKAKQKMYQYDTVQGSASDGTYTYYVLYNRRVEKCRIAKFKAKTHKLVKVSSTLKIDHGNNLAYDSSKKCLVATHCKVHTTRLSYINPKTLKVTRTVEAGSANAPSESAKSQVENISKYTCVTYVSARKQYVGYSQGSFIILDSQARPIKRVSLEQGFP